jgi:hypothetical protein
MKFTPDSTSVRLANSPNWDQILPPLPPPHKKINWETHVQRIVDDFMGDIVPARAIVSWNPKLDMCIRVTYVPQDQPNIPAKIQQLHDFLRKELPRQGFTRPSEWFPPRQPPDQPAFIDIYFRTPPDPPEQQGWKATNDIGRAGKKFGLPPAQVLILRRMALQLASEVLGEKLNQPPDYRPNETIPEDFYS